MGHLLERAMRARGVDPATVSRKSKSGKAAKRNGVLDSPELRRVLALPKRDWATDPLTPLVVSEMTALYRTPGGTMTLLPHQAWALLEAEDWRGCFGDLPVGEGKAQPIDEPVLTPDGWRPIGTLAPGDFVVGSDGTPKRVTGVYPQGTRDVFRLTFTDGSWTRSCGEHLWSFRTGGEKGVYAKKLYTRTLNEWVKKPLRRTSGYKQHLRLLPMVAPVQYPTMPLPLDPYTLGALIGDGSFRGTRITFTSMDPDIVDALRLPDGVICRPFESNSGKATSYALVREKRGLDGPNLLTEIIKSLGLFGLSSLEKHIPPAYMFGSVNQRLALLQGLLDTDGSAIAAGRAEYATSSAALARDVTELVRSLGGTATYGLHKTTHADSHRLLIKLPDGMALFRCARKCVDKGKRQRPPYRALVSVEPDGSEECVCIAVDSEDHLYVTRDYILTHNTILGFLLAWTGPYERPWLVQPATLIEKTLREFRELSHHWRAHPRLQIVSAELLGSHTSGPKWFETHMPDCLIFDEAHMFKNRDSARCRRVTEYHDRHAPTIFTMSGTYHEDSLRDYHHLQKWSLPPALRFLPDTEIELDDWADAVDTDPKERLAPGALRVLTDHPRPGLTEIRNALGDRARLTPGVISVPSTGPGCSIVLEADVFNGYGPAVDAAFECLENNETTDGWPVKEAIVQYMHQWTYCLGYEGYWDPRPPEEWRDASREWAKQVREILAERIPGVDSPKQVANAIDRGEFDPGPLTEWRLQKPTFTPNVKHRLIDDAALLHAADWLGTKATRKALWTRHVPFAKRLSEMTGVPYFGRRGLAADGRSIETYSGPAILSIAANKNGRNLQVRYDTFGIWDPPGTFKDWEQIIGRIHRRGQTADLLTVRVFMGCMSHYASIARARTRARNVWESKGVDHKGKPKLLLADWTIPSAGYFAGLAGPRWRTRVLDDDSVFDSDDSDTEHTNWTD